MGVKMSDRDLYDVYVLEALLSDIEEIIDMEFMSYKQFVRKSDNVIN